MAYQNIFIDSTSDEQTVYIWDDAQGLITLPLSEFNYAYVRDPKGKYISMTGERLSKTRRFIRGNPNVFESDLPKETRVLTDLYLNEDMPSEGNITLFFDIEVSMENGIPNTQKPNNEITSIAFCNNITNEYIVLVLDKSGAYENVTKNGAAVYFFQTEMDLLHAFVNQYEQIAPTIITGWNSNGFDVPYLYNRIKQICGASIANRLSPIGKVRYSDRLERYRIAGVSSLDYLDLYKKYTYIQQPNYRLDTIGRLEVGMGKVDYDGSLDDLFRDDLEKFIEYNLQDVRIIVDLDKKLKLIDLVRGICHLGHVPYEDYPMASRVLEGTIVTYLHRKGIIVADKPKDSKEKMEALDRGEEGFVGAYVQEPVPGLYDWVYSLDLQSLYPSIIMSLNISPETKVAKVLNFDMEKHLRKEIVAYVIQEIGDEMTVELEHDAFVNFLKENNLTIASNGVLYNTVTKGIIPEVLEEWFAKRVEYKNLMKKYTTEGDKVQAAYYDQRQHIQKIFLNSLYGVLGLPVFRFYDVDNAAAVTLTGQDVIKTTAKFINKKYEKTTGEQKDHCVYVDTDSVYFPAKPMFVEGSTDDLASTISIAYDMESTLNTFYDSMAKRMFNCDSHKFHIKGESVAKTGFWVAKKRYALDKVYDLETRQNASKLVVKGLDVVRSSFPKAFREFMTQMLKDILGRVDKQELDDKILALKTSIKTRHYLEVARNTSANNISQYSAGEEGNGMNKFKKGTPAHIKAAIVYNRLLKHYNIQTKFEPITDGAKIKYVYLKDNPLHIEALAIKGYQDPPQIVDMITEYMDTDALFENELRNKLDDFYTALKWGNIPTEINQNAGDFFSF